MLLAGYISKTSKMENMDQIYLFTIAIEVEFTISFRQIYQL